MDGTKKEEISDGHAITIMGLIGAVLIGGGILIGWNIWGNNTQVFPTDLNNIVSLSPSDITLFDEEVDYRIDVAPFRRACDKKGGTLLPPQSNPSPSDFIIFIGTTTPDHFTDPQCYVSTSTTYYPSDLLK